MQMTTYCLLLWVQSSETENGFIKVFQSDSVKIHTRGSGVRLITQSYSRYSGWVVGPEGDLGKPN